MKDESPRSGPGPGPSPDSHAESRASPDTEQLAAQMSALLADLVRTPQADLEDWTPSLKVGDRLGRFTLVRELGRGGMGVVWEAEDPDLARRVALKVVKPGANARVRGAEWLRREAEAVARLAHPNIVTLYDFGLAASGPFLVFELLRGLPLDKRLRGGPLPFDSVLAIAVEVGRALVHAHRAGVVHRDLKPANVYVSDSGDVKVLDFGLASLLGRTGPAEGGTPAFMAPEQWQGQLGDERTDLFALGVTLWAALTGGVPYPVKDGRSAVEQPGPSPRLPAGCAPPRFRRLVERCLERDPARRPASSKAVLDELRALQHAVQARGRRRVVAGLAAAVVAITGVAGWLWWSREPPPGERLVAVVADADNRSGDPNLDRVGELVAAALGESRRLAVVPRARLAAAAQQARLGEVRRLDGALARDLARVTGADLLLLPAVAREGSGLVLGLKGVDPKDERPRFTLSESARGPAEVPAVLDRLTEAARRKLHERREDLKAGGIELASAFSPNLEATREYFEGLDCMRRTDAPGAPVDQACPALFERALALDPAFALAHYQLAVRATPWGAPLERGRAHIDAAMRSVDRLPAREAALVRGWEAHLSGKDDEALRHYEALLARHPDDAEALERAGTVEWYRGRYAAAVPYLQRRLALDPGDEQARQDLVEALGVTGRDADLKALVAETRALPSTPQRHRAVVEGLLRLGEPEAAVALARAVHAEAPTPATRGALRVALEQAGRFEELEALQRADLAGPADRWYALAVAVAAQGRFREAEGLLEEGRRRDPRRERAVADQVRVVWLGDGRDPAAFRRALQLQVARRPSNADTLAVLAALRGEAEAATALLSAAAAPAPGARAQVDALLAWHRGDAAAALAGLAALDRSDPEPVGGLHPSYLLAEVAAAAGEPREALATLDRFARQPVKGYWSAWAWPRALLLRAQAHLALGERAPAREALDRLLATYRRADAGLPLLREARALRARL